MNQPAAGDRPARKDPAALLTDVAVVAARQLTRCGRWSDALALLDALADTAAVRLERARTLVDQDWWAPSGNTAALRDEIDSLPPTLSWHSRALHAQLAYNGMVRDLIAGRQQSGSEALLAQLRGLHEEAPDDDAVAASSFSLGVALEVLAQDLHEAARLYQQTLAYDDDYLAGYALRHLAGQAYERGDTVAAGQMAHDALMRRQRCGHLTGALAQSLQVTTTNVRDLVSGWGAALGSDMLQQMAKPT
jgi:hypothetical protein